MKKRIRVISIIAVSLVVMYSPPAMPDLFGGDVAVLVQIYANAIQQLLQLKQILSTGSDTLDLLRDINRGIRDGLAGIKTVNPKFNPGVFGGLDTSDRVLGTIQDLYGQVPKTSEAALQQTQDQSAAESIAMNGTLFHFADQADDESKRIIAHADLVNPEGAAKLTAQSIAVLIGVTTQVLRTNSMMLKMMGQDMATSNRKGKIESEQFKAQYDGLSNGIKASEGQTQLGSLNGG